MGPVRGLVLTGALALGMALGLPSSVAAGGSLPSTPPAVQCLSPAVAAPATAAQPHPGATAFAVSVPRFTFLERSGDGWITRTNTEAPPSRRDHFVVLANGSWAVASEPLTDLVLRSCG